jgi:hypothetical protein
MKRNLRALCMLVVAMAAVGGGVLANSAAPAQTASQSPSPSTPIAVLTGEGIPPARAAEAIELQRAVAKTQLVGRLEAALGEEFAGVWFEPAAALLHVGVTSSSAQQAAEAVAAVVGLQDRVVETAVRSTWAELTAAQDRWSKKLSDLFAAEEARTGLNARDNALDVSVGTGVSADRRAALEREAAAEDVRVVVTTVPGDQLSLPGEAKDTKCKEFAEDEAFCGSPLTAGVRIKAGTKICTAGPLAIPISARAETYMVTVGHCIDNAGEEEDWFAFPKKEEEKEIGPAGKWAINERGDYGKVKIKAGSFWLTGEAKTPTYAVTARWSKKEETSYSVDGEQAPVKEAVTCHQGQSTGEKCGKIKNTSVEATVEEVLVKGLVEHEAESAAGDSGGPYMGIYEEEFEEEEIYIEGTHVTKGLYMPIAVSLRELELELLTVGNEHRTFGHFKKKKAGVTTITGEGFGPLLAFAAHGPVSCMKTHWEAKTPAEGLSQETLTITPKYEGCVYKGNPNATVEMNGCDYLLNGTNSQFKIECPEEKSITVKGLVMGVLKCTFSIGAQTVGGATYTNLGGANGITVKLSSPWIKYSTTPGMGAGACAETAEAKDAVFAGDVTLKGTTGGMPEEIAVE